MPRVSNKGKTCQETNCTGPVMAKMYCAPHYRKLVRDPKMACQVADCTSRAVSVKTLFCHRHRQNPLAPSKSAAVAATITELSALANVSNSNVYGCWLYPILNEHGYSMVHARFNGTRYTVGHRLAYAIAKGEPKPGMDIHHTCANRPCVNPEHLVEVTKEENRAEMHERNRMTKMLGRLMLENERLNEEVEWLQSQLTQQTLAAGREALTV
jgi:hypothetical protein